MLKGCPFCKSESIDPKGWASLDRAGPACDDCGASADTVEKWNTRPIEDKLREERDELKSALTQVVHMMAEFMEDAVNDTDHPLAAAIRINAKEARDAIDKVKPHE